MRRAIVVGSGGVSMRQEAGSNQKKHDSPDELLRNVVAEGATRQKTRRRPGFLTTFKMLPRVLINLTIALPN